jgi:hypothetical protein
MSNKYGYTHSTTRESQASLYRAQNKSILGTLVVLIAITALIFGVIVVLAQLGIF